jgi:nucleotidyltransferase substrate binding protein (TIGR01987 family)
MIIQTDFLDRCIKTITLAYSELLKAEEESIEYELYRSATIKEFEIILEQSGKLLKRCLAPYMHSKRAVDRLYFKDVFRHAAKYDLMTLEESERWLMYRDNRNALSHDYGKELAEETLPLIPKFIEDARSIIHIIERYNTDQAET